MRAILFSFCSVLVQDSMFQVSGCETGVRRLSGGELLARAKNGKNTGVKRQKLGGPGATAMTQALTLLAFGSTARPEDCHELLALGISAAQVRRNSAAKGREQGAGGRGRTDQQEPTET